MSIPEQRQGGDLRGLPDDLVDLSTCVNPYGPPPAVLAAAAGLDAATLRRHPYGADARAAAVMAAYLRVPAGELAVGRGISGLLWRLQEVTRQRGVPVHVPRPAYTEFRDAFGLAPTPDRMRLAVEDVEAGLASGGTVLLANPENASGVTLPRHQLSELAAAHPDSLLVVDESYVDFTDEPDGTTLIGHAGDNVCVLRSVSKFHGLAGVRVGVAWAGDEVRRDLAANGPWPTSAIDVALLEAALADPTWSHRARALLREDQRWLDTLLARHGLSVQPTSRTHVRLVVDAPTGAADALLEQGVRVRLLDRAHGLERSALRLTAPHATLRRRVEDAFAAALGGPVPQRTGSR